MSLRPICVPCRRFFRPEKNGVYFVEGMPRVPGAEPGTDAPEDWTPYKLWNGDLWRCPGCGTETIVGVGRHAVREHHQSGFADDVRKTGATIQVNDC